MLWLLSYFLRTYIFLEAGDVAPRHAWDPRSKIRGKRGGVGREEEVGREKRRDDRDRKREGIGKEYREMLSNKPGVVAYVSI